MQVFLSYHAPDRRVADDLKIAIERDRPGTTVLVDHSYLRLGHSWLSQLAEGIKTCNAFVILVGNVVGPFQKEEYRLAYIRKAHEDEGFVLLPVIIADEVHASAADLLAFSELLHSLECPDPTAPEPLVQILAALDGRTPDVTPERWRTINPYRGLAALRWQEADYFVARNSDTEKILNILIGQPKRLIALVGNSGVGKSSLVNAGVIGSLKRRRWPGEQEWPAELGDSSVWQYLTMAPGPDPIADLADCFLPLLTKTVPSERYSSREASRDLRYKNQLVRHLKAGGRVAEMLDQAEKRLRESDAETPVRFCLYIDEWERLYHINAVEESWNGSKDEGQRNESATPEDAANRFSRVIAEAVGDPRLTVMASLRADHYGRFQADRIFKLAEIIDVGPLDDEALKRVLKEPSRVLGVSIEREDLVDRFVQTVHEQPGALPLLADLMTGAWRDMQKRNVDGVLRLPDTTDIGAALVDRADKFIEAHRGQIDTIRDMFTLRLVHVSRHGEPLRRRLLRSAADSEEWELVNELADPKWRLLIISGKDDEAAAEVAHDVLLRTWPWLKEWIEKERAFLIWRHEIDARLEEYEEAQGCRKRLRTLLTGLQLSRAEDWLKKRAAAIHKPARDFISISLIADRSWRWGLATLAALAVGVITWNWYQAERAETHAQRATIDLYELVAKFVDDHDDVAGVQKESVRQILNGANAKLDQLSGALRDDPDLERNRIMVRLKLGAATMEVGELGRARKVYEEAARIAMRAAKAHPTAPDWQAYLASMQQKLGEIAQKRDQLPEARDYRAAAIASFDRLAREAPQSDRKKADWQLELAISHEGLGHVLKKQGKLDEAARNYGRSREIFQRLADTKGDVDRYNTKWRRDISWPLEFLGDIEMARGEWKKARRYYDESLKIREELHANNPKSVGCECSLATVHRKMADAFMKEGDRGRATAEYERSREILERLVSVDPTSAKWQEDLALTLKGIALMHEESGDLNKAEQSATRARNIFAGLLKKSEDHVEWREEHDMLDRKVQDLSARLSRNVGAARQARPDQE